MGMQALVVAAVLFYLSFPRLVVSALGLAEVSICQTDVGEVKTLSQGVGASLSFPRRRESILLTVDA